MSNQPSTTQPIECDCLVGFDASLFHYAQCAATNPATAVDNTPERTLAELASLRDIDTALYALREIRNNR